MKFLGNKLRFSNGRSDASCVLCNGNCVAFASLSPWLQGVCALLRFWFFCFKAYALNPFEFEARAAFDFGEILPLDVKFTNSALAAHKDSKMQRCRQKGPAWRCPLCPST